MAVKCQKCEQENPSAANYCFSCGIKFSDHELSVEDKLRIDLHNVNNTVQVLTKALAGVQKEIEEKNTEIAYLKKELKNKKQPEGATCTAIFQSLKVELANIKQKNGQLLKKYLATAQKQAKEIWIERVIPPFHLFKAALLTTFNSLLAKLKKKRNPGEKRRIVMTISAVLILVPTIFFTGKQMEKTKLINLFNDNMVLVEGTGNITDTCCIERTIGTGKSTTHNLPQNTYYRYSYSQQIYDSTEIDVTKGVQITSISFQYIYNQAQSPSPVTVYLGNTTKSTFTSNSDWVSTGNLTQVYSGMVTYNNSGINYWCTITFQTPFTYTGGNLVVAVRNNWGVYPTVFYCHTTSGNKALHYYDGYYIDTTPPAGYVATIRNNIKFNFCSSNKMIALGNTFNEDKKDFFMKQSQLVRVQDFYISKYEVTQKQWKAIMNDNPSHFKGDNLPVENVSWDMVQEFIEKLKQKTGKDYRLPTAIEWEYAARGGNKRKGYRYSGSNDVESVSWFGNHKPVAPVTELKKNTNDAGNSIENNKLSIDWIADGEEGNSNHSTHEVGSKLPNELGIYDMSGNVWEWCSDGHSSDVNFKVLRGGSWKNVADCGSVCFQRYEKQTTKAETFGFRLACSPNK